MRTKIEHGTEHINSNGGIILVGQLLRKSGLDREVDRMKVGGAVSQRALTWRRRSGRYGLE
jgi:hypothetical protein